MNLDDLRLFVTVVQTGSLSKAAEQLTMPLPTISRRIAELEKTVGVQLLERSKAGSIPTTTGQKLYENSYLVVDELLNAYASVSDDEQNLVAQLRVSAPLNFTPVFELISQFQQCYPKVNISYWAGEQLSDFFADGMDVAFRIGALHTENVIAKPIASVQMVLVATPKFLQKYGTPQSIDELDKFSCSGWYNHHKHHATWQFAHENKTVPLVFASNDLQAVLHHVKQHLSLSFLLPELIQNELKSGELVEILPDVAKKAYPIHLIYPPRRQQSTVLKVFVEFCLEHFGLD